MDQIEYLDNPPGGMMDGTIMNKFGHLESWSIAYYSLIFARLIKTGHYWSYDSTWNRNHLVF